MTACLPCRVQGSIYASLSGRGYTVPAGTCVGVGVSGLTLGGGLGHATRSLGLMADSVLQATVVLPSGRVVTASPTSEPDLFWVSKRAVQRRMAGALAATQAPHG